jgi:5'-nucleotidase (lipoprotein e(P4) family)
MGFAIHYNVPLGNVREITMRRIVLAVLMALCACTGDMGPDLSVHWVRDAAEFDALAMQAYRAASDDLARLIADKSWTALPGQRNYGELPPAIILDVDETVVSNVAFQEALVPPFENSKHDDWNSAHTAVAVPGAVRFVELAREHGVELFFLTNRPCEARPGVSDPCPQEAVTVEDLEEAGIAVDAEHVMLANELPDWDREKLTRRNLIANDFRIIMIIGDDLSDFIPCVRRKIHAPCKEAATIASRDHQTEIYSGYWGAGWYVIPNPMHGSWTTVD